MNKIKSFTLYNEIFMLIDTIQPIEKRNNFLGEIMDYYFKDKKPNFKPNSIEEIIWLNISKPIISYKSKVVNGSKGGRPKKTENKTKIESESKTTSDVYVSNYDSNYVVNVNVIKEIIEYLNNKTNSQYRYNSSKTQKLIKARLNDGFVLDDFKKVIDNKSEEWIGTDFEKFLRPETLFGTKFESYLNQKQQRREENVPEWFNEKLESEEMTEEEQNEINDWLKEI